MDYYEDAAASSSHGMNEVPVGVRGNRYNDMAPKYVVVLLFLFYLEIQIFEIYIL